MKKIIIAFVLFTFTLAGFSQSFRGFFKPVTRDVIQKFGIGENGAYNTWLIRSKVAVTANKITLSDEEGKIFDMSFFSSTGLGLAMTHYTLLADGTPYSDFGVGLYALLDTQVSETDIRAISVMAAVTGWQLVNAGLGYDFLTKKPFLALGLNVDMGSLGKLFQ